jgi:hypothetical protein
MLVWLKAILYEYYELTNAEKLDIFNTTLNVLRTIFVLVLTIILIFK